MQHYPVEKIHKTILDAFLGLPELGLELVDIEINESKDLGTKSWRYVFCKNGSLVQIKLFLLYPSSYACSLMIVLDSEKYFSFDDYLTYIKSDELKKMDEFYYKVTDPDLRAVFLNEYLDLARKYLTTNLKKVARGEEWIDVPFDWESVGR